MTVYCEGKVVKEKGEGKDTGEGIEIKEEKEEEILADKVPREGKEVWGRSRKFEKQEKQENQE
jgi:Rieske Fe-S protein